MVTEQPHHTNRNYWSINWHIHKQQCHNIMLSRLLMLHQYRPPALMAPTHQHRWRNSIILAEIRRYNGVHDHEAYRARPVHHWSIMKLPWWIWCTKNASRKPLYKWRNVWHTSSTKTNSWRVAISVILSQSYASYIIKCLKWHAIVYTNRTQS